MTAVDVHGAHSRWPLSVIDDRRRPLRTDHVRCFPRGPRCDSQRINLIEEHSNRNSER